VNPETPDPAAVRLRELMVSRTARVAINGGPMAREAWLVLHGYGQLAERFLQGFLPAARPDRLLVAPEALSRFYTSRDPSRVGATWMTREARDAEIRDYLGYLDQVVEECIRPSAAARLEVHGFSQGTATATRWVAHAAGRVDRLVLWGGGIAPEVDLAALRLRRPDMEWHLCVGRTDEFISEGAILVETDRLAAAGVPFTLHRFDGGHVVDSATLLALAG